MSWWLQGFLIWLGAGAILGTLWLAVTFWLPDHHPEQRIVPTATSPVLDEQDVEVLIGLCEAAMDEEPYTNRAVFLCRLIDKLEAWMLAT